MLRMWSVIYIVAKKKINSNNGSDNVVNFTFSFYSKKCIFKIVCFFENDNEDN